MFSLKGLAVVIGQEHAVGWAWHSCWQKRNWRKSTVKEVADTTDINRKTFTITMPGVHQVIDEIETRSSPHYDQAIREVDARRDIKTPTHF